MTPEDMAGLHAACFETPRPWSGNEFQTLLEAPGVFQCSLKDGFALGRIILDEAELLTLAVAPNRRRRGLGRQLLAAFETTAAERGATTLFLEVSAENNPALALYESQGYHRSGRRRGYYRAPDGRRVDALILIRSLG